MLGKLATPHDHYHVHKTLGILSLASFVWHYCGNWPATGQLGASWAVIALHTALSVSGLQFKVPQKRIPRWPTMIWEEYRLHAIVFSFRAPVVAALDGLPRVLGIAVVHLIADEVTRRYGQPGNTTVRGEHARQKSWRVWAMTRSYAYYQYLALASHLVGTNSMDLGYNAFIAVQSSALPRTFWVCTGTRRPPRFLRPGCRWCQPRMCWRRCRYSLDVLRDGRPYDSSWAR